MTPVKSNSKARIVVIVTVCVLAAAAIVAGLLSADSEPRAEAESSSTPLNDDSAEVAATLPAFHRAGNNYTRGAVPNRGGLSTLKRLGVRSIVDLRSQYDHTDEIRQTATALGLNYYWMPTSVWDPPSDTEAAQFVKLVGDQSKGPFFVFCGDGLNRTGEMSALHRVINDGLTVEQALKEMDDAGFNPYYYNLRQYVWTYARKFRPEAVPAGAKL